MNDFKNRFGRFSYLALLCALLFIAVSTFNSCDSGGIVDKPPPFLEITSGPSSNEVLKVDKVSFAWKGSGSDYTFRYRLLALDADNFPTTYLNWTPYSQNTEVTFNNLDEGKFRFQVQGRSSGIEPDPVKLDFYVDAVEGPSLLFYKTKTTIKLNGIDSIGLWMEDIKEFAGLSVVIAFDKSKLNLVGASGGQFVMAKKFNQVIVPDLYNAAVLQRVNQSGRIELSTAILMDLGSFPSTSISGSGKVLNLVFKGIAKGQASIDITSLDLRNSNGNPIPYNSPKNGIVVIE
ncbi:MAG TPA: hypothetical protein PK397_04025 [Ignavibacteriaceae bacterium]|jgi:hypothetical protein|nr:hypothetical protein [Ignavibacteriaceae bacterium]